MSKVSKRNIQALGKVNFSAKIDFSADGGLKINEIEQVEHIETVRNSQLLDEEPYKNELNEIFGSVRLNRKQKELLELHFLSLKEAFFLKGKKEFNAEYKKINGLGRVTAKILLASFEKLN